MDSQVVVITGASAGVGRATARAFGQRRAQVGLLARGRDGLEAAKQEIEAAGGKALVVPVDVANPEKVEAAAQAVEENLGPIDVWVNNAMAAIGPVEFLPGIAAAIGSTALCITPDSPVSRTPFTETMVSSSKIAISRRQSAARRRKTNRA